MDYGDISEQLSVNTSTLDNCSLLTVNWLSPQSLTKASQKRRFLFGDGYLLAIDLLIPYSLPGGLGNIKRTEFLIPSPQSLANVAQWEYSPHCVYRYKPG